MCDRKSVKRITCWQTRPSEGSVDIQKSDKKRPNLLRLIVIHSKSILRGSLIRSDKQRASV